MALKVLFDISALILISAIALKEFRFSRVSNQFKKMNLILLVFLTIITFGAYIPLWFLRQREAINDLHSEEKLYKKTFILLLIIQMGILIVSLYPIIIVALGYQYIINNKDMLAGIINNLEFIIRLVTLIPAVILLFQALKVRRIFIDHFNDNLKKDIWVSGLFTFIFHIFYLQ